MLTAFVHGCLLALGLILPLGPQNTYVFAQGAIQPIWTRAARIAIVAALCDTLLIVLAVVGVSTVVLALPGLTLAITSFGVLFLLYLGWTTWHAAGQQRSSPESSTQPARRELLFVISISLLNPHAILDTIGVIGTSGLAYSGTERQVFTLACILVSWLWFMGLALLGRRVGQVGIVQQYLGRVSAIAIWISAAFLLRQVLQG